MNTIKNELSCKQLLADSALYSAILGILILGTAKINPEIWLNGYPPDIKEKHGPMSPRTRRQASLVAIPFFAIMVGTLVWSNLKLKRQNNGFHLREHLQALPMLAGFALIIALFTASRPWRGGVIGRA